MTNEGKHTAGPWRLGMASPDINATATVRGPEGIDIAHCFGDEAEANARLIAAAPDLAERVRELEGALAGCADALREAGKDFALGNPRAARPNLYELHEQVARAALAGIGEEESR